MNKSLKISLITLGVLGTGVGLYFLLRTRRENNGTSNDKDDSIFNKVIRNTFYSDTSFPLKRGSGGDKVKGLQRFLNNSGSYGLKEDGKYGPATETAVKNNQEPIEQFKVSYPNAVYGQVSQGYYNDFVKVYEGANTIMPTGEGNAIMTFIDRDNDGISDYIDGDGGAGTNFTGGYYNNASE